jgi:hypothetical protein
MIADCSSLWEICIFLERAEKASGEEEKSGDAGVIRFFFGLLIFGVGGRIIKERHSSDD